MTSSQAMSLCQAIVLRDLTAIQVIILSYLDKGNQRITDIARACGYTNVAAATNSIDHMERRGLVFRRHAEEDRRVILVNLSAEGRAKLEDLLKSLR